MKARWFKGQDNDIPSRLAMDEDLHVALGRFERDDRHVDRLQGIGSLWDVG